MAVARGGSAVTRVRDVRRHVAFRANGTMRMFESVQAAMEDVEGAITAGQYGVAAFQARIAVLGCLSIRSLAVEGELEYDLASPSFDGFAGLSAEEIEDGLSIAVAAVDVDALRADAWLERLQAFLAETERRLGYADPLPLLRSPHGPMALVSLTRRWTDTLDELGLPPLLKPEWISGGSGFGS